MKIGFDAKRAFHNATGLGNYSRTLIADMLTFYPHNEYYLFNTKPSNLKPFEKHSNAFEILPSDTLSKKFPSLWRTSRIKKEIKEFNLNIYHGLSHEIPFGMKKLEIPTVVTIHDLIFERYPNQFNWIDRKSFRQKYRYACAYADKIIAISNQTKSDLINLYSIKEDKIKVCYQSCNPLFKKMLSDVEKEQIRKDFNLPEAYFLYVGSIIERKNLLGICKAMSITKDKVNIPLVVIGNGKSYKRKIEQYIHADNLSKKVLFLSDNTSIENKEKLKSTRTLAAIYQMAEALIYPSFFEGFGLPVLEALCSRIPVITSNTSCLPETGGDAACYINPESPEEIAEAMIKVHTDKAMAKKMVIKGIEHARKFDQYECTAKVVEIYKTLIR